jgi:hypothetical protein
MEDIIIINDSTTPQSEIENNIKVWLG